MKAPAIIRTLLGAILFGLTAPKLISQDAPAHPTGSAGTPIAGHAARTDRRPSIGVALEGGGALGFAHVGVVKWMYEHHVPIDRIAGTSMGALVGAIIASGQSPEDVEKLASSADFEELFTVKPALSGLSFRRREDREYLPQALTAGLRGGNVTLGNTLIEDNQLNALLARVLEPYNSETLSFDDLPIPYRCVATDLTTLRPLVFNSGSLPFAVRASISIPGVFAPVLRHGDMLVDGAIMDNLPTDVVARDLNADVVISVYLGDSAFQETDAASLVNVFARALQAGTSRNVETNRGRADIEIAPAVSKFSAADYHQASALVKAGYDAAESQRSRLLVYALNQADWEMYTSALRAKQRPTPALIRSVRVEGPDAAVSAKLTHQAGKLAGQLFDPSRAEAVVSGIRGGGAFDAYYETFHAPAPSTQDKTQHVTADDGVVIHWHPREDGPPYLLIGADVVAMSSNVNSTVFDMRFLDQNLGGYGSELRSDVRLGYLTHLATEYYRPIGQSGFFIQPQVQFLRQPVYVWENQKRVSERLLQRAGGGIDAGFTFSKDLQAAIQYRASTVHWNLRDGADESPTQHLSGRTESVAAHVLFSNRTAEVASPKGTRVDLLAGHLFQTTDSRQAPFMKLNARQTFTFAHQNLLSFAFDANTYFRSNVADPLRFTLGGPLRLYASSIDEYRGTDTALAQATYLRRIARLPTGLGQGIYFATGYEAGNIWSPERTSILRQDGFGGILVSTPLGAITVGGAIGDAGRRKAFFTFGRLF